MGPTPFHCRIFLDNELDNEFLAKTRDWCKFPDMKTLTVEEATPGLGRLVELALAGEQIQNPSHCTTYTMTDGKMRLVPCSNKRSGIGCSGIG
jgi:hypothetical protein